MKSFKRPAATLIASAFAIAILAAGTARAQEGAWAPGANWLSIYGGDAKSSGEGSANSGGGAGFGASHMLSRSHVNEWNVFGFHPLGFLHVTIFKQTSFGGTVRYDVLGRYGNASEVEIPMTADLTRHFKWKAAPHPYLSIGGGPFYRKITGTTGDQSGVNWGYYLGGGLNMEVAPGNLLGLDVRFQRVNGINDPPNPVFGSGELESTHWSIKLAYSRVN